MMPSIGENAAQNAVPHLGRNLTFGLLDVIGRAVVKGDFNDVRFPTEADLARTHGVSRSVTREATKMLAAKGLLSARPRQGTFVQPNRNWNLFDPDVLRWLREGKQSSALVRAFTELRLSIESHAASLAANRGKPSQIHAIAAALERMQSVGTDIGDGQAAQVDFHGAVLRASGNPFFLRFQEIVETAVRSAARAMRHEELPSVIDDYVAIHAAIARGDEHAAYDAMHDLIANLLEKLEQVPTVPNEVS